MNTGARDTKTLIEEFAKYAHGAVDMLRERAIELDGNMASLANETNKLIGMVPEGTKLGKFVENNPAKAQLYALMTGAMFTHLMKTRGLSFGTPIGHTVEGTTEKPKTAKVKVA
jgi:hypothetical protein